QARLLSCFRGWWENRLGCMIRHLAGAPAGVALADPHQYSNCRERVYREEHPELCPIERAESPTAVPSRGHGGGGSGGGMQGLPVKVCKLEQCGPLYLWAIPALVGPVSGR